MAETDTYQTFKDKALHWRDRCDRIENLRVAGMPDVNVCIESSDAWIEIKSPIEPKRPTTRLFGSNHKVSQNQKNWFLKQRNAGGAAWFLIQTDRRWLLVNGFWADNINDMTVKQIIKIAHWHAMDPVSKEQWEQLRRKLAAH